MAQTIWLTGLSGAGKSTLAQRLSERLAAEGVAHIVLDGDAVRAGLCRGLGFTPADRQENIRRVAEVAALVNRAGITAICALISPRTADRASARQIVGDGRFLEVHIATPLEVCERRDPKGLYRKARAGEVPEFTGVSSPYEAPTEPEAVVDASSFGIEESAALVHAAWMKSRCGNAA